MNFDNPQIADHYEWIMSYELTTDQQIALERFYADWAAAGSLPNIDDYLDIGSIIFQ